MIDDFVDGRRRRSFMDSVTASGGLVHCLIPVMRQVLVLRTVTSPSDHM